MKCFPFKSCFPSLIVLGKPTEVQQSAAEVPQSTAKVQESATEVQQSADYKNKKYSEKREEVIKDLFKKTGLDYKDLFYEIGSDNKAPQKHSKDPQQDSLGYAVFKVNFKKSLKKDLENLKKYIDKQKNRDFCEIKVNSTEFNFKDKDGNKTPGRHGECAAILEFLPKEIIKCALENELENFFDATNRLKTGAEGGDSPKNLIEPVQIKQPESTPLNFMQQKKVEVEKVRALKKPITNFVNSSDASLKVSKNDQSITVKDNKFNLTVFKDSKEVEEIEELQELKSSKELKELNKELCKKIKDLVGIKQGKKLFKKYKIYIDKSKTNKILIKEIASGLVFTLEKRLEVESGGRAEVSSQTESSTQYFEDISRDPSAATRSTRFEDADWSSSVDENSGPIAQQSAQQIVRSGPERGPIHNSKLDKKFQRSVSFFLGTETIDESDRDSDQIGRDSQTSHITQQVVIDGVIPVNRGCIVPSLNLVGDGTAAQDSRGSGQPAGTGVGIETPGTVQLTSAKEGGGISSRKEASSSMFDPLLAGLGLWVKGSATPNTGQDVSAEGVGRISSREEEPSSMFDPLLAGLGLWVKGSTPPNTDSHARVAEIVEEPSSLSASITPSPHQAGSSRQGVVAASLGRPMVLDVRRINQPQRGSALDTSSSPRNGQAGRDGFRAKVPISSLREGPDAHQLTSAELGFQEGGRFWTLTDSRLSMTPPQDGGITIVSGDQSPRYQQGHQALDTTTRVDEEGSQKSGSDNSAVSTGQTGGDSKSGIFGLMESAIKGLVFPEDDQVFDMSGQTGISEANKRSASDTTSADEAGSAKLGGGSASTQAHRQEIVGGSNFGRTMGLFDVFGNWVGLVPKEKNISEDNNRSLADVQKSWGAVRANASALKLSETFTSAQTLIFGDDHGGGDPSDLLAAQGSPRASSVQGESLSLSTQEQQVRMGGGSGRNLFQF